MAKQRKEQQGGQNRKQGQNKQQGDRANG